MKPDSCRLVLLVLLVGCRGALAAITPEQAKTLPPPASRTVNFSKDIKPIFEASCVKCHGRGRSKGDFRLDTRESILKGGESGPAVVSGRSLESHLIELVSGVDPDNVMPQKGSKLTRDQVSLLRAWIDQGLSWDEGVSLGRLPPVNLFPRRPQIPTSTKPTGSQNPVDRFLQPYFAVNHIQPGQPVQDRVFARRVYLDVIGLLPTPTELSEFLGDPRPDKRQRLVRRLLADNPRYAQHWLTFWNDALRNDYKGTGYIDGGRKQITEWLYAALAKNMPYDQFVSQLINPTADSEGFSRGIVWRGVVNSSQTPEMQAAQNISQVFMGVNLKCASCHDSFINDWTLADSYGLASIYGEKELEMMLCDKPTAQIAPMKFLYPELGNIDPKASRTERLKQLADIITQKQNGRLSRTIVNRLWARFVGRGLVEPVDEMENAAWNSDLLDWLASDLVDHGYDLKQTIERILTSEAYQLPVVPMTDEKSQAYVFRGPTVRRLSAEQYSDALAFVTGVGYTLPTARTDFLVGTVAPAKSLASPDQPVNPKWIWKDAQAAQEAEPSTVYFRKIVELAELPTAAVIVIACDSSFRLYVNGHDATSGRDYTKPNLVDVQPHLVKGPNVFAVAAVKDRAVSGKKGGNQSKAAGLLIYAHVRDDRSGSEHVLDFASDASWVWSGEKVDGWEKSGFSHKEWASAAELGDASLAPWRLEKTFTQVVSMAALHGRVRASLVSADPLMIALGRPNREQVMTGRSSVATTLQALELTNGGTLAARLKQGADKLLQEGPATGQEFVARLYQRALSRPPTNDEMELAVELVGSPAKQEGVEDLLWAMTMLPEFQLIY